MKKTFFSNFLLGSKAAEEMFSSAAKAAEAEAAVSANTETVEAGEGDLDQFFGDLAEEQKVADAEAEAAAEAERARLIRQYANSFKDRILKEITNKDWDHLVRSYERSTEEEDLLMREVAILYNNKIAKALPPQWWEKRAPELRGILGGDQGCFEILLAVIRSEVSQKANIRRQAAASNLLKQVKAAALELGLNEAEFPHKALSAADTETAAVEIGRKCLVLATGRAIRQSLLTLRDRKVRIPKEAERAFYLITSSDQQKWGTICMASRQLITAWQGLEEELLLRASSDALKSKLKREFFTISLEDRAIQVAGHCHLNLDCEVENILKSGDDTNKD